MLNELQLFFHLCVVSLDRMILKFEEQNML